MITPINPNIQFNYYELHNHVDQILLYCVNKVFTVNIKLFTNWDDDSKYFLRQLIATQMLTPSNDVRFEITHNLINSFKQAHND
jgi:hypothetical protein